MICAFCFFHPTRIRHKRLSICWFPALDLLGSRFATLVVISLVIAGVSTVTLIGLLSEPVASPLFVFAGLTLVGVTYAMLGMLVVGTAAPPAERGTRVPCDRRGIEFDADESAGRGRIAWG